MNEPDNHAHKRQRKICAQADAVRKEMTKQRQVEVLKRQQGKREQKLKLKQTKINQTMLIDLD